MKLQKFAKLKIFSACMSGKFIFLRAPFISHYEFKPISRTFLIVLTKACVCTLHVECCFESNNNEIILQCSFFHYTLYRIMLLESDGYVLQQYLPNRICKSGIFANQSYNFILIFQRV